ncbi:hypothetical protein BSL78_25670 [Apostichopus japonicus]|uniref:Ig-like domain-containing protein n=1 Tax=Stichopus japonicus TaxID=307972 RepID=A0A2G8JNZ9_STIJA|nr:hypothetical protein BSL78_25670 [Apostichopus japonicus]
MEEVSSPALQYANLFRKVQGLRRSIRNFILKCRVTGQAEDKYPEDTTVELLVTENFPVVNELVHQQHVVLEVSREDKLTCTMNRVSQTMVLEWVLTPPVSPDEISIENELSKTDNRDDGTSNITFSSSFRVLSQSIQHVTLECRVVDENDGSQHDVTTVELLFDNITYQECESLLNWQSTLAIVLLVFLVVNVICVFWMKPLKEFARKYHSNVANPGQQTDIRAFILHTDLEEDGTADNQYFQELSPLQPVNNKDNIEAGCIQCSHFREMHTKIFHLLKNRESFSDSGMSSCPSSSTVSGDTRELEGRNTQDTEDVLC